MNSKTEKQTKATGSKNGNASVVVLLENKQTS
jgi:hypothetical protein